MDKVNRQKRPSEDWARYMGNLVQLYPPFVFESGYLLNLVRERTLAQAMWMAGAERDYGFVPFLGPM